MPALRSPSVIASYHNIKTEETVVPNFNQRKAVLQDYPPHDYQRAKLSTFYLFLKGSLGHQNHQLVTTCSQWHDSD
jgi:hypothetical protein